MSDQPNLPREVVPYLAIGGPDHSPTRQLTGGKEEKVGDLTWVGQESKTFLTDGASSWTGTHRFLFAVYFALRDMTREERAAVIEWAVHEAEHPIDGAEGCRICQTPEGEELPFPDWWPPLGFYHKFPYAALIADCERWAREGVPHTGIDAGDAEE